MRVAVVDVGSNTVRLLVSRQGRAAPVAVRQERQALGLGASVERCGRVSEKKLQEASDCVREQVRIARKLGVELIEVLVASPGRQAENGAELLEQLRSAAEVPVRQLTPEEEGRLAYDGALAADGGDARSVTVCDVGGGSTQLVFGTPESGPVWLRSVDLGSLRLTQRLLSTDPAGKRAIAAAAAEAERAFEGLAPPLPELALAVGGSARVLRKLTGRALGARELQGALKTLAKRPSADVARSLGVDRARARTLPAGAVLFAEVQRRLGVPLKVARGGLREGAVAALLARLEAA